MIAAEQLVNDLGADRADQEAIEELEVEAVARVQEFTGRYFGPVISGSFVLRGSGTGRLWLPEPPTATIATVVERAYAGDAAPLTITASADDGFEARSLGSDAWLERKGKLVWVKGYEYTVAMSYGYADEAEPAVVRNKVRQLVTVWWGLRDMAGGAFSSQTEGRVTRTVDREAEERVLQGLLGWRRPGIAARP